MPAPDYSSLNIRIIEYNAPVSSKEASFTTLGFYLDSHLNLTYLGFRIQNTK